MQLSVADEREAWYGKLVGDTANDRLIDFRKTDLKKIRIYGKSKR